MGWYTRDAQVQSVTPAVIPDKVLAHQSSELGPSEYKE